MRYLERSPTRGLCRRYTRDLRDLRDLRCLRCLRDMRYMRDMRDMRWQVARFKYPPHWLPLGALWEAMVPIDPATGLSRGYAALSRLAAYSGPAALTLTFARGRIAAARRFFAEEIGEAVASAGAVEAELWAAVRAMPPQVADCQPVR